MNKKCEICGNVADPVLKNGEFCCSYCGNEVDVTRQDNHTDREACTEVVINVVCPICKNANNNTLRNGKCRCVLCGTLFDFNQQTSNPQTNITVSNGNYIAARRAELEKQKNNKLIWGIVWLFLFWPVSIYHFCKMYQISQEISKL